MLIARRRISQLLTPGLAAGLGVAVGAAVTFGSPLYVTAALLGSVAVGALLTSAVLGLVAVIGLAELLPFAVLPFRVGVQATLLDATLGLLFLVWGLRALHSRHAPRPGVAGLFLAAFIAVGLAAQALWTTGLTLDELNRQVLKLFASMVVFYVAKDLGSSSSRALLMQRTLVAGATAAAAVASCLWALPAHWQVRLLSQLAPLGYPSGQGVLRFLPGPNNTYTETLRAVGTSIDPNVLGGMLMLAAAVSAGHMFGSRPLAARPLLMIALAALVLGMALSYSRSAWVGFAAALAYLAAFRSRWVLLLGLVVGVALLLSPFGQSMLQRLAEGFTARDPASALRLAEYANAAEIISRYPVLGIGFGAAPDLDLQEGVSSLYLTVAEQTGLLGLAVYLSAVALVGSASVRAMNRAGPTTATRIVGLQAALVAALVAGLFDHYFVNKDFPHMVALFWLCLGLLAAATEAARPRGNVACA